MPTTSSTLDQLVARNSDLRRRSEELERLLKEQEALHQQLVSRIWQSREILDQLSMAEAEHSLAVDQASATTQGTLRADAS